MPKPEIHYSHCFGMGFWIDEDGTLMSCPAIGSAMDVENAIAVSEWICTLKRDYVNIGYYAERFGRTNYATA